MKIAFVSDDHLTISAHFGRALFYEIFTMEAGKVILHDTLARSQMIISSSDHQPGQVGEHPHDHNAMIAPIADCQVLLTRGMGRGAFFSLQDYGILPFITDVVDIQAALKAFQTGTLTNRLERLH